MDLDFAHLHHAYLVVGNRERAEAELHALFERAGEPLKGSPDFFVLREETFGIDAARSLSVLAARKAFGARKVFFVIPESLTREAQNGLLKTFEEPVAGTHFFLLLRDDGMVLPTLRSRVREMRLRGTLEEEENEAKKFLNLSLKYRLTFVKNFVDNEKNLSAFLDDLLLYSRDKRVHEVRLLSDELAASSRLILEHLAVVL